MKKGHIIAGCLFVVSSTGLVFLSTGIIVIDFKPGVIYLYGIILFWLWYWWLFMLRMCISLMRATSKFEEAVRTANSRPPSSMELKE